MKTVKFGFILIALMLGTSTLFAQGWRNANRPVRNYEPGTCVNILLDLTEDQKAKITELETAHQEAMAELRIKQRSTFEPIEKNEIRGEMLKKVKAHRDEVKNLLTEEQQKQYVLLHARNNYGGRGLAPGRRGGRCQAGYAGRGGRGYRGGW
ncbi:MAG: Spy/CpxP family protein refolding chaperone [Bacteroidales bacterium]|nr:Spy/CpxP family protein refolding chaperone [Bacteroidales bacterium]